MRFKRRPLSVYKAGKVHTLALSSSPVAVMRFGALGFQSADDEVGAHTSAQIECDQGDSSPLKRLFESSRSTVYSLGGPETAWGFSRYPIAW